MFKAKAFHFMRNIKISRALVSGLLFVFLVFTLMAVAPFSAKAVPAGPVLSMGGWKDSQTKIVVSFNSPVHNGANGALNAADFTVAGTDLIAVASVAHTPMTGVAIITLSGSLDSESGTDFTIACAADAVFNDLDQACTPSAVNVYTSVAEDTSGPVVQELVQISDTAVFIMFNGAIDSSTAIAGNFTLTTSDSEDDSSITSVNAFTQGVEITASGATIAAGSGNTLAFNSSVTDVFGNASEGATVTILPSIKISEVRVAGTSNSKDEFIELYNFSPNSVNLSSLKLHFWNQGTTTDTNMPLTLFNTTIPANGFFLITPSSFVASNGANPDATYPTSSAQLVSNGAVYISYSATADTDVVDLVGWGTSTKKEGTVLADIAAGTSVERKANLGSTAATMAAGGSDVYDGNGAESQNNLADFVVQATSVPQDSFFATEFPFGSEFNEDGDVVPPTVTDSFPDASSSSFIPANLMTAGVDFSETMNGSTVNTTTVTLVVDSAPGVNLCQSVAYDPASTFGASTTCTLNSASLPLAAVAHTLTVTTGVADIAGNNLATNYTVSFTPSADMSFDSQAAPEMVGSFPSANSISYPPNGEYININFNQSLLSASLTGNITLVNTTQSSAEEITGMTLRTVVDANDSIELDVSGVTFVAGESYLVTVTTGVTSSDSVAISGTVLIPFTVASTNDVTGPVVVVTDPANSATGVGVGMPIIHVSLDDVLNSASVSSSSVQLMQGSDVLPATVSYNPDWREIEISSAMAFDPSTVYAVRLGASGSANEITNVSGVALQDTDGTANNYYIFSFTTGSADVTEPTASFATATQNSLEVTFAEMMLPSSIENLANWSLESPISTSIPLSAMAGNEVSWNPTTMTATLTGFSLTVGETFQITAGVGIRDMAGNALAAGAVLGGSVLDVATYGADLGPGGGFTGDTWDMPTGFSTDNFGFVPQAGVWPMNGMAGATSNYRIDFPIAEQIRSSANNGKVVLTFPTGFDVSSAAAIANNPSNDDVNGPGAGTIAINSVTPNEVARTITVDFSIATRCGAGNTDPCAAGDEMDFIGLDLSGIVNSTVPRSWETSGYTVDFKTMTSTTLLETMTSMPFFINAAGANSLAVDLTAGASSTGTVVVHAWSPTTGEMMETANFATDGDGTAAATFTGLPEDYFDIWTDPLLTIAATDDFQGLMNEPVWVTGATETSYTLTATSGLQVVTVNVTGATGKDIDVIAGGPNGFQVQRIASTTGSDQVTMKLPDGEWNFNIGPHMPMDGGFIMPEPPDYIVAPNWLPVTVANPNVTEASGTANDGIIAFALSSADWAIPVNVVDTNGNPIVDAMVSMDDPVNGFGTFGQTSTTGQATLNVNAGTYRVGASMQGVPPTGGIKVKVDSSGYIYQEGSVSAVAAVTLELSKGGTVISGTVTDGTSPVGGAGVHAYCTANCEGYFDAGSITDPNGGYTLYVGNGTWNVEAFIPGYGPTAATSVVMSGTDQAIPDLSPDSSATFRTISGTVCQKSGGGADCSGGTGISGIEVFAHSEDAGGGSNFAKTANDGTYSLRVPGAVGYTVEAWDHRAGPLPIITGVDTSSADATDQDIVIDTPEGVTVNIKDSGGDPVTLNEMFIEFFDDSANIRQHLFVKDASSGVINVPEGTYDVFVHSMSAPINPVTDVLTDNGGTTVVTSGVLTVDGTEIIKVVVPALNTISGQLTDGTDPVPDAWIEVSDPTSGMFMGTSTDTSGNYSIDAPAGDYQVNAFSPGLILDAVTLTVDGLEALDLVGSITDQTISGSVTDLSGNAVPYAFVAGQKDGGGIVATQANADGEYSLPVDDGAWTVTGNGHGYEPKTLTNSVAISGGSVASTDVQFTAVQAGLNNPTVTTITPSDGGMASDPDLGLSVTIPSNATSSSTSAGSLSMKETNNIVSTATTDVVGNGFEVSMTDNGGTQLTTGFIEEVTIERTMSVADLNTDGVTTSAQVDGLTVAYFSNNGTWVPETTTTAYLDASGDVVASPAADLSNVTDVRFKTAVDHFTVFAITTPSDGVAPAIPLGVSAVGASTGNTVSWTAVTTNSDTSPISDLAGYELYRDTSSTGSYATQVNSSDITETSYEDTTAAAGTTYYYKVTAADTGGLESDKSSAVSATRSGGGSSTGGVTYTAPYSSLVVPNGGQILNSGSSYAVTFNSGGSNVVGTKISLSTDGGLTYPTVIVSSTSGISYNWTVLDTDTDMARIKIQAVNSAGSVLATDTSDANFTIVGTTLAAAAPPAAAPATPVTDEPAAEEPAAEPLTTEEIEALEAAAPAVDPTSTGTYDATEATEATPTIATDLGLLDEPTPTETPACEGGTLIKGSLSAVYYCGADGKRYVFPNQHIYNTWYADFSSVITVTDAVLASAQLGGNVTYKPGVRMIKITSDPKTYAVSRGGYLRWVQTEEVAVALYGAAWNTKIDDVDPAFFFNYSIGDPITIDDI